MPVLDIEPMHAPPPRARGFTLIELAVVLFLVALLLGALLGPVTLRLEAEQRARAEAYLAEVKQALIGFALRNRRLPCTDSGSDGLENRQRPSCDESDQYRGAGFCDTPEGQLPHADLGVAGIDPWGRAPRYYVSQVLVSDVQECPNFGPGHPSRARFLSLQVSTADIDTITIQTRDGNRNLVTVARSAAAAVLSQGAPFGELQAGSDEAMNLQRNTRFVRIRPPNREAVNGCNDAVPSLPACHFNDIVDWLPLTVLQYHLVAAGHQL